MPTSVPTIRRNGRVALICFLSFLAIGDLANAGDDTSEAVEQDRKRIQGIWKVVALEVNGNNALQDNAKHVMVVNGSDGAWSIRIDEQEIAKGVSTIDPTQQPKTIDFTPTEGAAKGSLHLGIYELGENARKLCFSPAGQARPTEFSSTPGSQQILVMFERESK